MTEMALLLYYRLLDIMETRNHISLSDLISVSHRLHTQCTVFFRPALSQYGFTHAEYLLYS